MLQVAPASHKLSLCRDAQFFEALCERVEERELLVDTFLEHDLAVLGDCDDYFLFLELCRAILCALLRDESVVGNAAATPHPRLLGVGKAGHKHGAYPPSSVLPYEGMGLLAAPLAYLHSSRAASFYMLRAMYCRCAAG